MIQEGPIELPSEVAALPTLFWIWFLLVVSGAFLLWLGFGWIREARRRRRLVLGEKESSAEIAHATSAARALALLHKFVLELSSDQRREAECLSHLLREQVGRGLALDCHSDTDAQLLDRSCTAPQILAPLLAFASSILYADQLPNAALWNATLKDVAAWLDQQEEPS